MDSVPSVLPDHLPEPLAAWDGAMKLMSVLLGTSLGTFVISLGLSPAAAATSLCGVAAAGLYFWRSNRSGSGLDMVSDWLEAL